MCLQGIQVYYSLKYVIILDMVIRDKKYFEAVAVMVGYTIGVGIFSLPFLTARAGVLPFLFFIIFLGSVQYLVQLIYANLIIVTKNFHRLPGYVGLYLGERGKIAVFIAGLIGDSGALIAYMIITGIFLHQLLGPSLGGTPFIYSTVSFALEAIIVFFGISMIARFELLLSSLLLIVVTMIVVKGSASVEMINYVAIDWRYLVLPYGAMLVALDGGGSLPIIGRLVNKEPERFKSVIRYSMTISFFVTLIFALTVVGITGNGTTPDSLTGLEAALGKGIMTLSLLFGLLCMSTSVLGVAESAKETLWWDFGLNKYLAWALTILVPYTIFALGVNNLISVISFIGAVSGGFCVIMLILVFRKLKKENTKLILFKFEPSDWLLKFLIILFAFGMIYEISQVVPFEKVSHLLNL